MCVNFEGVIFFWFLVVLGMFVVNVLVILVFFDWIRICYLLKYII